MTASPVGIQTSFIVAKDSKAGRMLPVVYSFVVSPDMCTGAPPGAKVAKIALLFRGGIYGLPYEYLISHNYHLT